MILILALLLVQDSSVTDLIRLLDDDAIEVREKATAELVRRGEEALPRLRTERDKTANAEVRARLEEVIARIEREVRRKTFKGGPVVAGLASQLRADEGKDGKITLTLEIMNVDERPRDFVPALGWSRDMPEHSASFSSAYGGLVVKQLTGTLPTSGSHLFG